MPRRFPRDFLMVTRGGAARHSLRRPMADATSGTPKAVPLYEALRDHQKSHASTATACDAEQRSVVARELSARDGGGGAVGKARRAP